MGSWKVSHISSVLELGRGAVVTFKRDLGGLNGDSFFFAGTELTGPEDQGIYSIISLNPSSACS